MHSSLSHDFLNDNDFLLSRTANLFQFLCIRNKALIQFFHHFTDFLSDYVKSSVGSHRSTTLHVCLLLDHDVTFDKDFSFIRASRTVPHDVLIQISFGRSELTDLNSILISSCQHHYNAVQYSCYTCTKVSIAFFCSDRLYVHDSLGVGVIVLRSNDLQVEIFYKFLIVDNFLLDSFTDVKGRSFDLCLRSSLNLCNVKVFSCQSSYNFFFFSFCRCCSCYSALSACRYSNCCCSACSKCSNRDLKVDILSFSDVDLHNTACYRCCCRRCYRCRCRCCFLFFLFCRCARSFYSIQYISSQWAKRITSFCQFCS